MKLEQLEISSADKWKGCSPDNNLWMLFNKSQGSELTKIENLIIEINRVNSNGILSDGSKYGIYVKDDSGKTFKLWWNQYESRDLSIDIKIDMIYSTRIILERDGFEVYGINENGPHHETEPALKSPDGTVYYYLNGKKHNHKGPAVTYENGNTEWYINGDQLDDQQVEDHKLKLMGFDDDEIDMLDLLNLKE
jgi:hypothetical protein